MRNVQKVITHQPTLNPSRPESHQHTQIVANSKKTQHINYEDKPINAFREIITVHPENHKKSPSRVWTKRRVLSVVHTIPNHRHGLLDSL
jgi:hypothetical protein